MDIRKHINTIGIIYIVFGALYALGGLMFIAGMNMLGEFTDDDIADGVLSASGAVVGVILLLLGGLQIAAGIGLRRYENWARILAIVVSVIVLFSFPIGTIIGAYSLWVLFKEESRRLFEGSRDSRGY